MQGQEIWTFQVSLFLREGDAGFPVQDLRAFHAGRRCRIYHEKQGLKFLCFAQHKRIQDIRCGVAGTLFCGGLNDAGEAAENSDIQEKAYQFGKAVI